MSTAPAAGPTGAEPTGAEATGAEPVGAEPIEAEASGAEPIGAEPVGAEPTEPRRPGSALRMFAMSVLLSEAFVVLFAALAAFGLDLAAPAVVFGVGGVVMFWCVLAAALLRGRAGYVLGSLVQLVLVASGFAIGMMFAVGAVFAILWMVALRSGRRIDVEREERYQAGLAHFRAGAR
ncbi:MAG: DUF4233 domain-containing protein [Georgenia sp.]